MKFEFIKSNGRMIYDWAIKCPRCGTIEPYDFEKNRWALDPKSGGLAIECKECKFGQVIKEKDLAR